MHRRTKWLFCLVAIATTQGFAQIQYSIQDSTPLLDAAYYAGDTGLYGAPPVAAGRWAYFSSADPTGTKVAFLGLRLDNGDQDLFVVNVGEPSSWRQLSVNSLGHLERIVWTPDGQYIVNGGRRVRVSDGAGAGVPFYVLPLGSEPVNNTAICQSSAFSFEFNTPGDLAGWGPSGPELNNVNNFTVANGVLSAQLTGFDPYFSTSQLAVDADAHSFIVIRWRVPVPDLSGQINFGRDGEHFWAAERSVNFKGSPDPSNFYTHVIDMSQNPNWTGEITFLRIDPVRVGVGPMEIDFIAFCGSTTVAPQHWGEPIDDDGNAVYMDLLDENAITRKPSNNLGAAVIQDTTNRDNIIMASVLADGSLDSAGKLAIVTDFTLNPGQSLRGTELSHDGELLAFYVHTPSAQPDPNMPGFESDLDEVYLLTDVQTILDAPQSGDYLVSDLAPTSLADPRITALRVQSEAKARPSLAPLFSQDKKLLFWAEDQNERWVADQGFTSATRFTEGDWDVGISRVDDMPVSFANNSNDLLFTAPGNDALDGLTPGGTRIFTRSQTSLLEPLRIFIATFRATQIIPPTQTTDVPPATTEVTINGEQTMLPPEIVLTDSAVQATEPITIEDPSGTTVEVPMDQVINFPAGTTTKSIVVETPVAPTTFEELPEDLEVAAVPVKRTFGPAGTQFFPPISVTITYTDAEVEGLDEASVTPYLFNEMTNKFDTPVPESDIVNRDLENNKITFVVDHFSTYGLGFGLVPVVPAASKAAIAMLMGLVLAFGVWIGARRLLHT